MASNKTNRQTTLLHELFPRRLAITLQVALLFLNLLLPDAIPFLDEILQILLLFKTFRDYQR